MSVKLKRIDGQWQLWIDTAKRHRCLWWDRGFRYISYSTEGAFYFDGDAQ